MLRQNFWTEISLYYFWRCKIQRNSTLIFYGIGSWISGAICLTLCLQPLAGNRLQVLLWSTFQGSFREKTRITNFWSVLENQGKTKYFNDLSQESSSSFLQYHVVFLLPETFSLSVATRGIYICVQSHWIPRKWDAKRLFWHDGVVSSWSLCFVVFLGLSFIVWIFCYFIVILFYFYFFIMWNKIKEAQ